MDPLSSNISTIFKVTADDYGYCLKRNNGIIESVENGIVNSVSVLVNGSCVEPIALQNCQKRVLIGLHLNLTEGNPITTPAEIPTLLQSNRRFYPKLEFYHRLNDNKVLSTEVLLEIEAQVLRFRSIFQKPPDYIDGHQHVHVQPIVRDVLVHCMKRYHIVQTRIPSELSMDSCEWITNERKLFNKEVILRSKEAKECFQENSITFPPYFIGLSVMSHDLTREKLTRALEIVKDDRFTRKQNNKSDTMKFTIEIMTHPGYPSEKHNGGCSSDGPDEFACSRDRSYEKSFLTDITTKQLLQTFADSILATSR